MLCLLAFGSSFAQKNGGLSGKIVDEKAQPIPYALVTLMSLRDTTVMSAIQCDLDGNFAFSNVKAGNYLLSITMVGYKKHYIPKFTVAEQSLKIPNISLQSLTKQLKEVSVVGAKPFIERRADKTILNVENSITSSGGSALDVLEKAPGVSIDRQNDQIKLNAKNGVTVMIDGKANILSGADLTTMLSNMSSEQIGTIEIITNPSSKYDAAGNAGIINIKLKKNKNFGTNGSLSGNLGKGIIGGFPSNVYRNGLNLNLNHRIQKWNVFGNVAYADKSTFNRIVVDRTTTSSGLNSKFSQNFGRTNSGDGYAGKLGVDYYASAKTTFGVMLDANTVNGVQDNISQTYINELKANVYSSSSLIQQASSNAPVRNFTGNFNIKHDFKASGENISFDADYAGYSIKKVEGFSTDYLNSAGTLEKNTLLRNNTAAAIDIFAVKTDYTLPISNKTNFEAGLKSSYVKTDNNFLAEQLLTGSWQKDAGKSNQFIYKENINAVYANLTNKIGKWEVQTGLRAENTNANGQSVTDHNTFNRNYLSLFPTLFVGQEIGKSHHLRYSYGRRIDRPSYQQLNPFVFYMDPYALDQGNPYLKPQYTNNFELGYSYKNAFSLSLSYADTKNQIVQITTQDDVTRVVTVGRGNIGRTQTYVADLSFPLTITKWWTAQSNITLFKSIVNDGNLSGGQYNAAKVAYNLNTSQSFRLPNNFSAELSFWLNSPSVNGIETATSTRYALNAGVQKSLMQKKMKLRLSIDDIFLTNQWAGNIVYQNLDLYIKNHSSSRRASFNVSYSFGNQNVKSARNRKTATEDIKGRATTN